MRTLLKVQVSVSAGNRAIVEGTLPKVIGEFLERYKPEAAYFTTEAGNRTAFFVVDMASQADMPPMAEPFFSKLEAAITFTPVMNADDLRSGLSRLQG